MFSFPLFSVREVPTPDQPDPRRNETMLHDSYELISCAESPLSAQIRSVSTSFKSHLSLDSPHKGKTRWGEDFFPFLSGCHLKKKQVYMWTVSLSCLVIWEWIRSLLLQGPATGIHADRWVRSSHCGTNDWPASRSSESGEEPTSSSQQE